MSTLCAQIDKLKRILSNLGARIHWPLDASSTSSSSTSNSQFVSNDESSRLRPLVLDNLSLHTNLFSWTPQTDRVALRRRAIASTTTTTSTDDNNKKTALFESASLYIALCSYRNQLSNHLVRVSFVSVALAAATAASSSSSSSSTSLSFNSSSALDVFQFLATLFNREFIFRPGAQQLSDDFDRTLNCLLHLNIIKPSSYSGNNQKIFLTNTGCEKSEKFKKFKTRFTGLNLNLTHGQLEAFFVF